ncbi:hypothetical protein CJ030_MR3G005752 [Morella rubra]|uniref:Uncharacterized protein n=1 Tax=Morella rubra TaxID=262757 RepID=A0A6A1W4A7_9ROSI|nr:hypothetical protein CJ030_MR3G005752 [Morella rubra]
MLWTLLKTVRCGTCDVLGHNARRCNYSPNLNRRIYPKKPSKKKATNQNEARPSAEASQPVRTNTTTAEPCQAHSTESTQVRTSQPQRSPRKKSGTFVEGSQPSQPSQPPETRRETTTQVQGLQPIELPTKTSRRKR